MKIFLILWAVFSAFAIISNYMNSVFPEKKGFDGFMYRVVLGIITGFAAAWIIKFLYLIIVL